MGARELISIDEARKRVLAEVRPLPIEHLEPSLGRVLAEPAVADEDLPPFDASAMDGFAVPSGEPGTLRIEGESRAGAPSPSPLAPGTACRISTGAVVPAGTFAVVPVEATEQRDGEVSVPATEEGANVRRAGEDVHAGETVIEAGTELGPAEVAVLASLGKPAVACARVPLVAIVVTGDELVEPGADLGPGQIRNSNLYALSAQTERAGARVHLGEQVGDDFDKTKDTLERALAAADVVCVSGGVSVGPHDHVKPALAELGVEERFWGVRLQPGKPTWFGDRDEHDSSSAFPATPSRRWSRSTCSRVPPYAPSRARTRESARALRASPSRFGATPSATRWCASASNELTTASSHARRRRSSRTC